MLGSILLMKKVRGSTVAQVFSRKISALFLPLSLSAFSPFLSFFLCPPPLSLFSSLMQCFRSLYMEQTSPITLKAKVQMRWIFCGIFEAIGWIVFQNILDDFYWHEFALNQGLRGKRKNPKKMNEKRIKQPLQFSGTMAL